MKAPLLFLLTAMTSLTAGVVQLVPEAIVQPSSEMSSAMRAYGEQNLAGAVEQFKALAEKGDANAMYALAVCLENGEGLPRDFAAAEKLFRAAAAKGHLAAQAGLGQMLTMQGLPQVILAEGEALLQKAIERGDLMAGMHLGDYYIRQFKPLPEEKVEQWKKARALFEKGAATIPACKYRLALILDGGMDGSKADPTQAQKLMEEAANGGSAEALLHLARKFLSGENVAQDQEKGRSLLEKALKTNKAAEAQYQLGLVYENGIGVKQDAERAVFYYRQSAESGNADANLQLGVCLDKGFGVEKDQKAALEHIRLAAESGSAVAMYNMAIYHELGQGGLKVDPAEACRWYLQAAEAGSPIAMNEIAMRYKEGKGVMKDMTAAIAWLDKAVTLTAHPSAQINLGHFFEEGIGVPQSYKRAGELYELASMAGRPEARYSLAKLHHNGLGVPKDPIAAYVLYSLADKGGFVPAGEARTIVEKEMSPDQLAKARQMLAKAEGTAKAETGSTQSTTPTADKPAQVRKVETK